MPLRGHDSAGARLDLRANRNAVGVVAEADERQQKELFEGAEPVHTYVVGNIARAEETEITETEETEKTETEGTEGTETEGTEGTVSQGGTK